MSVITLTHIIYTSTNKTLTAVPGKIQRVVNTSASAITVTYGTHTQSLPGSAICDFWYDGTSWFTYADEYGFKYLTALVGTTVTATHYVSANYTVLDADGYRNIFVDTTSGDVTVTLPLKANNENRSIRIKNVKGGTNKVIISPHSTDANKLSGDGLASIYLPCVGDHVDLIESSDSGYWEIVTERITGQLRLQTYAGMGSTQTCIPRFTTLVEYTGNMFSHNHTSGYNSNADGLAITINKSGNYVFQYSNNNSGNVNFGLSKDSTHLSTSWASLSGSEMLGGGGAYGNGGTITVSLRLKKNSVVRPHTDGNGATTSGHSIFNCTYLG